jgi:hypothetical protein
MAVQALGWLSSKLGVDMSGREKESEPTGAVDGSFMSAASATIFGENNTNGAPNDGLPEERNWYVYNESTKMYEPTPEAPAHIHAEHREKVQQQQRDASGANAFPEPPPPPPPPPPSGAPIAQRTPGPGRAQYADAGFFKHE